MFTFRLIPTPLKSCVVAIAAAAAAVATETSAVAALVDANAKAPSERDEETKPLDRPRRPVEGYRLQLLDEPLELFQPSKPRTKETQTRVDALAWFMTGQLRESRNDFQAAFEAYSKAVELDPEAIAIYQRLIPLAFSLNKGDEGIRFAKKAVELDPENYQLLRRLGVHMAGQRKIPEAVQLLEQALDSELLKKQSADFVTLNRDLALLYGAIGRNADAAKAYTVVFEALTQPGKYKLDFRTRALLLGDPSTTYEKMGQVFLDAEQYELALSAFEKAVEARKGKPGALSYNLALVYQKTGKTEEALKQLQKYFDAQLQSRESAAYQLLADVLESAGRKDELIGKLEDLAEKDSRNSYLQYFLADQYLANDRLDDAKNIFENALKGAKDRAAYVGLATVYRRQSRPADMLASMASAVKGADNDEELEAHLEKIENEVKAAAEDEDLKKSLFAAGRRMKNADPVELTFPAAFVLGEIAAEAKDTDAAVEFYRFALKAKRARAAVVYQNLGQTLLLNDRYADAVKVYEEATADPALQTARANFLFRLAQAREYNGQTDEALKAIREAIQMIPKHPLLRYQEAWIHYHARRFDKAITLFENVIKEFPTSSEIVRRCQFSLSALYVQQGERKKGEEILEKILADEPDDPSVNNDLGYLYADQGKHLEQAEQMIKKAVAAEPENPAYLDSMGWVLFKLDRPKEAVDWLKKAVDKPGGGDATIWDHLGDAYNALKKSDQAQEAWQKALEATKKESSPDQKLVDRIKQKLTGKAEGAGDLRPEGKASP